MPTKNPSPQCAAKGCPKPRRRFSRFCPHHQRNLSHHGHYLMCRTSERLFTRYRPRIVAGLLRYSQAKPMQAACQIADQFLNYRAEHGFTYELQLENWANRARAAGVSAMDVLRAVAEFHAFLDDHPRRFPDVRAERYALARRVLLLGPSWGTWRPRARVLNTVGAWLKEALASWAYAFLRKLDQDDQARRELRQRAADFDSITTARNDEERNRDPF